MNGTDARQLIATERRLRSILEMAQRAALTPVCEAVDRSLHKLLQPMQLAIIGKISSSKSTLVNAILRKDGVMSTGHKEVTYNVGWLKYGDPEAPVTIHYKDGHTEQRQRDSFGDLESLGDNASSEVDEISYIEVTDNSEMLREVNIIDTPGLDALRGKDSQNTLDFISKVRPDAVIMLFTNSIAESVLDVVRQFNHTSTFNPLNAVGVLAKIDVLWQESMPRPPKALPLARKVVSRQMERDPRLRKTLYGLYPVAALLFMAASTFSTDDLQTIKAGMAASKETWTRSLRTVKHFLDTDNGIELTRKQALLDKIGLYGVTLAGGLLQAAPDASVEDIRSLFGSESGGDEFTNMLISHFSKRARIIKSESAYQDIMQAMSKTRAMNLTTRQLQAIKAIEDELALEFAGLKHEHDMLELLEEAYSGLPDFDDEEEEVAEEIKRVCGEYGASAPQRLGLEPGTDCSELIATALDRENYWRKQIAFEPDPELKKRMTVLLKTYSALRFNLKEMWHQYEEAKAFIFNENRHK